jgi:hypothetical protein
MKCISRTGETRGSSREFCSKVGFMLNLVDNLQYLPFLSCFLGLLCLVSLLGRHIKQREHELFSLCYCSVSALSSMIKYIRRSHYLLCILPNGAPVMKNSMYDAKLFFVIKFNTNKYNLTFISH